MPYYKKRNLAPSLTIDNFLARMQATAPSPSVAPAVNRRETERELEVVLRNIQCLIAECRDVVSVGGSALDVAHLLKHLKASAETIRWCVEGAAEGAGLVAV